METSLFWIVPAASLIALILAWYFFKQMMRESEGTETMQRIASFVRTGAMSYLKQQYKIVGLVFLGLVIFFSIMAYGFNLQNHWVPVAGRIPWHENGDIRFGANSQRRPAIAQPGTAHRFP